jgi:hypothetical protein
MAPGRKEKSKRKERPTGSSSSNGSPPAKFTKEVTADPKFAHLSNVKVTTK